MAGSRLDELASLVGADLVAPSGPLPVVFDVVHDSRRAGPGRLFVAVRGTTSDGHDFVERAVSEGTSAVCVERDMGLAIPQLVVDDTRRAMGPLAARTHGDPSRHIGVVGVTGTNGKTTVTHYIESIGTHAGMATGLIGTIETRLGSMTFESERTTPEATDFQRLLAVMREEGSMLVAAEVSSHALALGRVRATSFAVAAFTNLSQDHLDFHGDMGSYWRAKASLFTDYEVGTAVVNVDDPAGRRIVDEIGSNRPELIQVGAGSQARVEDVEATADGTTFHLITPWGSARVKSPVVGSFNVENALVAAVCCLAVDIPFERVASGLEALSGVPGRFEQVSGEDPIMVIVDYAHTPAGIVRAIETARGLGRGRVIALVGAGGDRDREKRPVMGSAASAADLTVITSDNPRSEAPEDIVASVLLGVGRQDRLIVEVDRREAIRAALQSAEEGDVVLVLGRGHEPLQEVGGSRIPFDDRVVVVEELAALRSSTNSGSGTGSMVP